MRGFGVSILVGSLFGDLCSWLPVWCLSWFSCGWLCDCSLYVAMILMFVWFMVLLLVWFCAGLVVLAVCFVVGIGGYVCGGYAINSVAHLRSLICGFVFVDCLVFVLQLVAL